MHPICRPLLPGLCLAMSLACVPQAPAAAPAVSGVRASQRPGTQTLQITYDLAAEGAAAVSLEVSDNGGLSFGVPVFHCDGPDYGGAVQPGPGRRMTWDAGKDWPGKLSANIVVRLTARDNSGPLPAPAGMVWIPGGVFQMGSPAEELERQPAETAHPVKVSGFFMGRCEVTQGQYLSLTGTNPSYFNSPLYGTNLSRPVECVSWFDATNYCQLLTQAEGRAGSGWRYRLPTEAEWEYACRGGTLTPFSTGSNLLSGEANFYGRVEYFGAVGSVANPAGLYPGIPTPGASYPPNAWGLYDMHGNLWEWCQDWEAPYPAGLVENPQGPETGIARVIRGGGWYYEARYCRSARRSGRLPENRDNYFGFRIVLAAGQP